MNTPVKLETATVPPLPVDPEVVAFCEKLVERAKAGEFNGIAIVTMTCPNVGHYIACGTAWAGEIGSSAHTAVGGVEVLKHRMLSDLFNYSAE